MGALTDTSLELRSIDLTVRCSPLCGFVITAIEDATTGLNALWAREPYEPAAYARQLGPSGDSSIETFMDLFVGGWFEMFPSVGYPGMMGGATSHLHGEICRLPWEIIERRDSSLEARVRTLRTPFEVIRR